MGVNGTILPFIFIFTEKRWGSLSLLPSPICLNRERRLLSPISSRYSYITCHMLGHSSLFLQNSISRTAVCKVITVFLNWFGSFLETEITFSKL